MTTNRTFIDRNEAIARELDALRWPPADVAAILDKPAQPWKPPIPNLLAGNEIPSECAFGCDDPNCPNCNCEPIPVCDCGKCFPCEATITVGPLPDLLTEREGDRESMAAGCGAPPNGYYPSDYMMCGLIFVVGLLAGACAHLHWGR